MNDSFNFQRKDKVSLFKINEQFENDLIKIIIITHKTRKYPIGPRDSTKLSVNIECEFSDSPPVTNDDRRRNMNVVNLYIL